VTTNAAVDFEKSGTVGMYTAPLPVGSPGEEIANDPTWAQKLHRALEQSDRAEGMPWREFLAAEVAQEQAEGQG
jgi:hypothetical protein